ncbi:MAG: hypothetical protein DRR19_08445 [Candidatus Parabeggiatoa sp. nov. 1]|nr:MAG: hypothetical protein DRR19_08445 [Gammaproteobacteria bacterium]
MFILAVNAGIRIAINVLVVTMAKDALAALTLERTLKVLFISNKLSFTIHLVSQGFDKQNGL